MAFKAEPRLQPDSNDQQQEADATGDGLMPIAIVGMSCRFSGGASGTQQLWDMLCGGLSGWSEGPGDRFNMASFYHPDFAKIGCLSSRGAYFLKEDVAAFDRQFFNINAVEAIAMDPQARKLLEVAFETFENAGFSKERISESRTGVFVGQWAHDYHETLLRDPENRPVYETIGTGPAITSNRISYYFNLKGPSFTVDTGCSASLIALHQAIQSLRSGETQQCFVAGVNLLLDPSKFMALSRMKFLSGDGRCYTFDHRASGYGRGEGVGGILIKPLHTAMRDGDPIRAVIRNSAVNQAGRSNGLTVPSLAAQKEVIQRAYAQIGLSPNADYFELHGTGTAVGDPIEAEAVSATVAAGRSDPLPVGSIKTNIGHCEAAAGIAGLIKAVLMLENRAIPPNLNFEKPNENIPLAEFCLTIPQKLQKDVDLRRISVNSFGYGGANAHVLLDRAPSSSPLKTPNGVRQMNEIYNQNQSPDPETRDQLFVLSGASEKSCEQVALILTQYIVERPESCESDEDMGSLARTLAQRSALRYRLAFIASNIDDLFRKLEAIQERSIEAQLSLHNPRLAFAFSGQGAQWHGMGRELVQLSSKFQQCVRAAANHLTSLGCAWNLLDELLQTDDPARVNNPEKAQPLCTAIQLAMVEQLRDFGIKPSAVVGHSSGETAAAYAAGIITFEDAMTMAYVRGLLVEEDRKSSKTKGAMIAVGRPYEETAKLIADMPEGMHRLTIACVNSPKSVTVSGDDMVIHQLHERLQEEHVFSRILKTNGVAYHSPHMQSIAEAYLNALSHIKAHSADPSVRMVSSATGTEVGAEPLDVHYWAKSLVSPVLFSDAVQKLCLPDKTTERSTIDMIVEIGPHSALAGPIKQIFKGLGSACQDITYASALVRDQNACNTVMGLSGALFTRGFAVDLRATNALSGKTQTRFLPDLPNYPWDHETSYWHESRFSTEFRKRKHQRHELLGVPAPDFNPLEPRWRSIIRANDISWLKSHRIQGQVIFPAAAYIVMALEAARQHACADSSHEPTGFVLRDVLFSRALIVEEDGPALEITFSLRPFARSAKDSMSVWDEFRIFSITNKNIWTEHCRGLVRVHNGDKLFGMLGQGNEAAPDSIPPAIARLKALRHTDIVPAKFYTWARQLGLDWRAPFDNISKAQGAPSSSICTIANVATDQKHQIDYVIHPGTLDACFQAAFIPSMLDSNSVGAAVPTFIEELKLVTTNGVESDREFDIGCQTEVSGCHISTIADTKTKKLPFMLDIKNLELTSLPQESLLSLDPTPICTNLDWELVSDPNALHLSSLEEIGRDEPKLLVKYVQRGAQNAQSSELLNLLTAHFKNATFDASNRGDELHPDPSCVVIFDDGQQSLGNVSESSWRDLKEVVLKAKGILWVTIDATSDVCNPFSATIAGFARTLRVENAELRFVTLDLDSGDSDMKYVARTITAILEGAHFRTDANVEKLDFEYAIHHGQLYVPRLKGSQELNQHVEQTILVEREPEFAPFFQQGRPLVLQSGTPGLLNTLRWTDDPISRKRPAADEVCFEVRAFGINFRDLLIAAGQLEKTAVMAGECSGIVTAVGSQVVDQFAVGDRICAFSAQPYASFPVVKGHSCTKIPDNMTFEVAASIPIVYATAVYAFSHLAQLQKGDKVLIHSATGGLGQAAVMLAQNIGAEVFVTVGNSEKKTYLMEHYHIAADHIFSSRTTAFGPGIREITNGRGVDVVLNSLTGEAFRASCNCLAAFGRFIEVGKRDLLSNSRMDMGFFTRNVTFSSVDLMLVNQVQPALTARLLQTAVALVVAGEVKPVNITILPVTDIEAAFRQMQAGRHMGKLVLTAQTDAQVKLARYRFGIPADEFKVMPQKPEAPRLREDASYLVVGGLGGLGRALIRWMARLGAKSILTLSRSGKRSANAEQFEAEMNSQGVKLTVLACDTTNAAELQATLVTVAGTNRPIRGIIQAAMVLQDALFEKMTYEQWLAATQPKIVGTVNLHDLLPKDLDFFIMLSSIVSIVGNYGQSNYAAGNSFLDAFARYRRSFGLAAHTINVGVVSDEGYVSENAGVAASLKASGFESMPLAELLAVLEYVLVHPQVHEPALSQTILHLPLGPDTARHVVNDARFVDWRAANQSPVTADSSSPGDKSDVCRALQDAQSIAEASQIASSAVLAELGRLLSTSAGSLHPSQSLFDCGVDSLIAVELRNWIAVKLKASVPLLEMLKAMTIQTLAMEVAQRSKLVSIEPS